MEGKQNLFTHLTNEEIAEEKTKEQAIKNGDDIMYLLLLEGVSRSEERRVGKECRL